MFLLLITFLHNYWGIQIPPALNVFTYFSTRMALAALTSLFFTLFVGKRFIKKLYEWKIGDKVRSEDCPLLGVLHKNKNDTPTMGGILILSSLILSLLLWMDLRNSFTLILLFTTLFVGCIGATDDYLKLRKKNKKGLSAKKKSLLQFSCGLLIALYLLCPSVTEFIHYKTWFIPPEAKQAATTLTTSEYTLRLYVPFIKTPWILSTPWLAWAMGLFIVFVIVGSSNAVNLTDGLDGLATVLVMLAAGAFALLAFVSNHREIANYLNILYIEGSGEIAVFLTALMGATLGFLWYNGHPAQVFMGDTGSLPLGAILGVVAVLLKRELLLGIVGGVFVAEALSVMLQVGSYRLRNKKRVFLCAPLHHHFEYKGWPETKVVIRFWIIGLLLAIVGLLTLKFR
jgi:phospho-N-acetylmuramoyl-pentapeptide-transferase